MWHNFYIVVTLKMMFRQIGDDPLQIQFHQALQNIHNAELMLHDWELLMTHTNNNLTPNEKLEFYQETYFFLLMRKFLSTTKNC